jgi:hypothetical protein
MRQGLALILFLISISPSLARAAEAGGDCLKRVFGEFCLGGSLSQLMQRRPGGMPARSKGERSAVVFLQGRERIYVMAYQGRIYKVLRTYEPAGHAKLKELRQRLEAKYGPSREQSRFPAYARTLAAKIGAIRRGDAELRYGWQSAVGAWRIELTWTRELGVSLAYLANELDSQQRQAGEREL